MPSTEAKASKSGIVTDVNGERHIPSSQRADGTTRREIKIRPGYRPPEDVELYRNKTAQTLRSRGKTGVPGAEVVDDSSTSKPGTAASSKNAKRREARRKTKASEGIDTGEDVNEPDEQSKTVASKSSRRGGSPEETEQTAEPKIDPEVEREKKAKRLRKKLREARELQEKKERGEGLLPEQLQKAIKINEIIRELDQLGLDENGELKKG